MGNIPFPEILADEFLPCTSWSMDKVLKVYQRFDQIKGGAAWNIGYERFRLVLNVTETSDRAQIEQVNGMWEVIKDSVNSVNILEVVATLITICKSTLAEKVSVLFELFDVTGRGILNVSDLSIVVASCVFGMSKITQFPRPSHSEVIILITLTTLIYIYNMISIILL